MAKKKAKRVHIALSAKTKPSAGKTSKTRSSDTPDCEPPEVSIADGNRIVFDLVRDGIGKTTVGVYEPVITPDDPVNIELRPFYWWVHNDDRIHICTLRPIDVTASDSSYRGYAAGKLTITIRAKVAGVTEEDETFEYPIMISE
jgi:hypothetical protein